jgi:ankyrin repeat protein
MGTCLTYKGAQIMLMLKLHEAARKGDINAICQLLAEGVSVDAIVKGKTALHVAAENGHAKVVLALLEAGASIDKPTARLKEVSLHLAIKKSHIDVVEVLLEQGADKEARKSVRETPLHVGVKQEQLECVQLLLRYKADVNAQNEYLETPLHVAVTKNNIDIVRELLAQETLNKEIRDQLGRTALHISAANEELFDIMIELIEVGFKIDSQDEESRTSIAIASINNNMKAVDHLRDLSSSLRQSLDQQDAMGNPPLFVAMETGKYGVVRGLVQRKADINALNGYGETIAHVMADQNKLEAIKLLDELGADFSIPNRYDETAWYIATRKNYTKVADYLWLKRSQQQIEVTVGELAVKREQVGQSELTRQQLKETLIQIDQGRAETSDLEKRVVALEADHQKLMAEYEHQQQLLEVERYIEGQPWLRTFNYHLQSKLTELFLTYKVLNSKLVTRERSVKEKAVSGGAGVINLIGEALSIPGGTLVIKLMAGRGEALASKKLTATEERKIEFIANLIRNLSVLDQEVQACGRLLTFQYEHQILRLRDEKEVKKLVECAVVRLITLMREGQIDPAKSLSEQVSFAVAVFNANRVKTLFTQKRILTTDGKRWTDEGTFQNTGIELRDGRFFGGGRSQSEQYGYRLGVEVDITRLELVEKISSVTSHPLSSNPLRYQFGSTRQQSCLATSPHNFFAPDASSTRESAPAPFSSQAEEAQQEEAPGIAKRSTSGCATM